jgi:hypothetical protein
MPSRCSSGQQKKYFLAISFELKAENWHLVDMLEHSMSRNDLLGFVRAAYFSEGMVECSAE